MYRLTLPQRSFIVLVSAIMMLAVSLSAIAQTGSGKGTISGIVTDKDGEPVAGAFVFYKGTSTLTLHFKDIEAPDRCSGDLGPCVLGNFVAI